MFQSSCGTSRGVSSQSQCKLTHFPSSFVCLVFSFCHFACFWPNGSIDELGDFVMAMDEASKQMTEELTGKPYEAGDLSIELDNRVKTAVAQFAGKDEYEPGDLSRAVASRVMNRVEEFTGQPYEFGDISRKVEEHRQNWVKEFLGEEAAANYQFGDITKKALANFTGKDEYQFGDVSKKILEDLFGKRKKGN